MEFFAFFTDKIHQKYIAHKTELANCTKHIIPLLVFMSYSHKLSWTNVFFTLFFFYSRKDYFNTMTKNKP